MDAVRLQGGGRKMPKKEARPCSCGGACNCPSIFDDSTDDSDEEEEEDKMDWEVLAFFKKLAV